MEAPGDAAARSRPDATQEVVAGTPRPGGLPVALAASACAHALVVLLVASRWSRPDVRPALVTIPISLVGRIGGGEGGGAGPPRGPVAEPPAPEPPAAVSQPSPAPPRRPVARPKPSPHSVPPRVAKATPTPAGPAPASEAGGVDGGPGTGAGIPGGGAGTGGDGGGDGSGGARVAYGTNPLPPYPMVARRLGMEGVVLLDVVVAPDGRAADVRVDRSSGFPPLDQSAMTTVRERWRFVPARRDGVPVESRVKVPIRFRLDGQAG